MPLAHTDSIIPQFMDRLNATEASALLLDYDGTLAPFQTRRDQAYPYPGVVEAIENILQSNKTRVVMVSGRPIRELQTFLHPIRNLEIWGEHGMEHLSSDGRYSRTPIAPEVATVLAQAERWLVEANLANLAEAKSGGIAIHWRGLSATEIAKVQARAQQRWSTLAEHPGMKLLYFEGGLELRAAHPNKGDAISTILEDLESDMPVAFLGDDITDEDAFRALGPRGLSVLVRSEHRETEAQAWLRPPRELIDFLLQWSNSISA